jgi:hypothetical protein
VAVEEVRWDEGCCQPPEYYTLLSGSGVANRQLIVGLFVHERISEEIIVTAWKIMLRLVDVTIIICMLLLNGIIYDFVTYVGLCFSQGTCSRSEGLQSVYVNKRWE